MRWLFFTLLLFNMLGLYWFSSSAEHRRELSPASKVPGEAGRGRVATLMLLSEQSQESRSQGTDLTVRQEAMPEMLRAPQGEVTVRPENRSCRLLGPFSTTRAALEWQAELSGRGVESGLLQRDEVVREDFWVIVPPQNTRQQTERLLAELRQKKIDSFIIDSGEYANGISLGVFAERANTDNYRRRLTDLGVETTVVLRPHLQPVSWLQVADSVDETAVAGWIPGQMTGSESGPRWQVGQPCSPLN